MGRDCLIGFKCANASSKEYVFKYLPDMTKFLWIEDDKKDNAEEPMMQRGIKTRRKSKEKISDSAKQRRTSSGNVPSMSNEPNIKPSKANKRGSSTAKPKLKNKASKSSNANKFRRTKEKKTSKKITKKEAKPKKIKTESKENKKKESPKTSIKKKKPLTPTPIQTE